jgi:hypothetical protein
MAINKLYFSKVDYDWRGHSSNFLNSKNLDSVLKSNAQLDYHTSLEDIKTQNIQRICKDAKEIYVVDIDLIDISDMDFDKDAIQFSFGRLFYELVTHKDKVKNFNAIDNFNLHKFNTHHAIRKTSGPVLWTAGCSMTYGAGVEHSERWGTHLAQYLNMPEISLSKVGSSLYWAADQILRADINPEDIVVWGLTNTYRFDYAINWELQTTTFPNAPKELRYYQPEFFDSTTHNVMCIQQILQVINFCKKLNIELYLANLLDLQWISTVLRDHSNFIDLTKGLEIKEFLNYIDYGTDNMHPGPIHHKHYADQIFNLIKKRRSMN